MMKENIINKNAENIHGSFLIPKSTTGQPSSTKLPDSPGIYLFKKRGAILYIGKATSLKDRVKSYFSKDIIATRGPLIVDMIFNADKIDFIKTDSVLEALILESNLIKKYQPKYNTKEKDDKSYNYVVITDEDFPRVLVERGRNLDFVNKKLLTLDFRLLTTYGPFTNGTQLKEALKIIRKIFPFRDKCTPCIHPRQSASDPRESASCRPCFNYQIGLCPGVCIGKISKEEYAKTIKNIKLFFEGKKTIILKNLEKEMHTLAKMHEFEKAGQIKKTIFALNHIQDVSLLKPENNHPGSQTPHPSLIKEGKGVVRIEAYDVAHLSGTNTVGVMVVLENGELSKNEYRKFVIKESIQNDIAGLKEILERRLKHEEWAFPQMIVVDGGKAQVKIARKTLEKYKLNIPVISVLKNEYHKPKAILGDKILTEKYSNNILLANNEAHRFAIKYHKIKRSKIF